MNNGSFSMIGELTDDELIQSYRKAKHEEAILAERCDDHIRWIEDEIEALAAELKRRGIAVR